MNVVVRQGKKGDPIARLRYGKVAFFKGEVKPAPGEVWEVELLREEERFALLKPLSRVFAVGEWFESWTISPHDGDVVCTETSRTRDNKYAVLVARPVLRPSETAVKVVEELTRHYQARRGWKFHGTRVDKLGRTTLVLSVELPGKTIPLDASGRFKCHWKAVSIPFFIYVYRNGGVSAVALCECDMLVASLDEAMVQLRRFLKFEAEERARELRDSVWAMEATIRDWRNVLTTVGWPVPDDIVELERQHNLYWCSRREMQSEQ